MHSPLLNFVCLFVFYFFFLFLFLLRYSSLFVCYLHSLTLLLVPHSLTLVLVPHSLTLVLVPHSLSVQFKMVSAHSGKFICAPPRLSLSPSLDSHLSLKKKEKKRKKEKKNHFAFSPGWGCAATQNWCCCGQWRWWCRFPSRCRSSRERGAGTCRGCWRGTALEVLCRPRSPPETPSPTLHVASWQEHCSVPRKVSKHGA